MKTELRIRIESVLGFEFRIGYPSTYFDKHKRFNTLKLCGTLLTEEVKEKLMEMPEVLRVKETQLPKSFVFQGVLLKVNQYYGTAIWLDKNAKLS